MKIIVIDLKDKIEIERELTVNELQSIRDEHDYQIEKERTEKRKQKKREFSECFFDVISNYKKRGAKPRNMDALMDDLFIQMDNLEVDDGA